MKLLNIQAVLLLLALASVAGGCKDFLEVKPDKKLVVPLTLQDCQALLDNFAVVNNNDPGSGEVSADDYFLSDADFNSISQEDQRRMYTWQKEGLFPGDRNDWSNTYRVVFTANTVFKTLANSPIIAVADPEYRNVKGQAHFIRGKSFFLALSLWSQAYDPSGAETALGIPIRLGDDFNEASVRASVADSYGQVLSDLKAAAALLPAHAIHPMRPSKAAAFAMLARVSLAMREYAKAALYADSCLQINDDLLDFNTLNIAANYPFARFNSEVIYESMIPVPVAVSTSRAKIMPGLYESYHDNDLRKVLFFRINPDGSYRFKGNYEGAGNLFGGLATDEVYLVRAEGYIRTGEVAAGIADINTLLESRFKKLNGQNTYVPYELMDPEPALELVLLERRKELLMRGLRWIDLKRLNAEGAGINLQRTVNGNSYSLPANDNRYAMELPQTLLQVSGLVQNP